MPPKVTKRVNYGLGECRTCHRRERISRWGWIETHRLRPGINAQCGGTGLPPVEGTRRAPVKPMVNR